MPQQTGTAWGEVKILEIQGSKEAHKASSSSKFLQCSGKVHKERSSKRFLTQVLRRLRGQVLRESFSLSGLGETWHDIPDTPRVTQTQLQKGPIQTYQDPSRPLNTALFTEDKTAKRTQRHSQRSASLSPGSAEPLLRHVGKTMLGPGWSRRSKRESFGWGILRWLQYAEHMDLTHLSFAKTMSRLCEHYVETMLRLR